VRVDVDLEKARGWLLESYIIRESRVEGATAPDVVVNAEVSEQSRYSKLRTQRIRFLNHYTKQEQHGQCVRDQLHIHRLGCSFTNDERGDRLVRVG
jgi:hypothetical protein